MSYQSDTNMQTICQTIPIVKGDSFGKVTTPQFFSGQWYLIGHMFTAQSERDGLSR
jgi:hypothetical protein